MMQYVTESVPMCVDSVKMTRNSGQSLP